MSTESPVPRYRLDPHARFRVMDDEGIFVLQDAGEVLVVNQVGAFIVEQLQSDLNLGEVVTAITRRFEVDAQRAEADACSLLEALTEAGAVQRS